MKRFYQKAHAAPAADIDAVEAASGHAVLLDGRPIHTPGRSHVVVPTPPLADAIAAEWDAQEEEVDPSAMPMMALAATAIDRVQPQAEAVAGDAAAYAGTDLLCYRAAEPPELAERQAAQWQPLLDWAKAAYGAELTVTTGVAPVTQDNEALMRLGRQVARFEPFALAALHVLTTTTGSLVLALAVAEGRLEPHEAFEASIIDEAWQAELWGEEQEAARRRRALAVEIADAARFLTLLES